MYQQTVCYCVSPSAIKLLGGFIFIIVISFLLMMWALVWFCYRHLVSFISLRSVLCVPKLPFNLIHYLPCITITKTDHRTTPKLDTFSKCTLQPANHILQTGVYFPSFRHSLFQQTLQDLSFTVWALNFVTMHTHRPSTTLLTLQVPLPAASTTAEFSNSKSSRNRVRSVLQNHNKPVLH
jgi:hypothetical protein